MSHFLDMTNSGRAPVFSVKLPCPHCEAPFIIYEVSAGETTDGDDVCDGCGATLTTKLTIDIEFSIRSRNPPATHHRLTPKKPARKKGKKAKR